MAAPILRHYFSSPPADAWTLIGSVVPAGRVFVVSKLLVAPTANGTVLTCALAIAPSTAVASSHRIMSGLVINQGEGYTESGFTMMPGEGIHIFASIAEAAVHVFGQEVDL